MSCTSATFCLAAGFALDRHHLLQGISQTWNGTGWTAHTLPGQESDVLDVSCTSPDLCLAVGTAGIDQFTSPQAWRWDGTTWTALVTPKPNRKPSNLQTVSCTSATACTAVGNTGLASPGGHPFAEFWNGTGWTIRPVPGKPGTSQNVLSGISCPSVDACVAAGSYTPLSIDMISPLAGTWNGTAWTVRAIVTPPGVNLAGLADVSCSASAACTAAGTENTLQGKNRPLFERWNGTTWSRQTAPKAMAVMNGISCPAVNSCTAVGASSAEHWNGTTWTVQPTPTSTRSSAPAAPRGAVR